MTNSENVLVIDSLSDEAIKKHQTIEAITKRLTEIETLTQSMKALYDEKEKLTAELMKQVGVGTEVTSGDMIFSVVDNFADKNVVFRPAAVRRFDLEVDSVYARQVKAAKEAEKAAKKASKKNE